MVIFTDDAPPIAATVITITTLAYVTFGLRIYTRTTRKNWGREDYIMTVALFPFSALAVACLLCSFNGIGVHAFRFEEPGNEKYFERGLFWFFLFEVFYGAAIVPIKLSISFMLVRISASRRAYVISQYVAMTMFTLVNVSATTYIIFQCTPIAAAWKMELLAEGGHCGSSASLAGIYYSTTAINIATDWFTALIPIPLIWNMKLDLKAKISVGAILGLGVLASISGCVRLKYTVNLTNEKNDYHYGLGNIVLWGYAENGIGMFVGNLATLRPLLRSISSLGSSDSKSGIASNALNSPQDFSSSPRFVHKPANAKVELEYISSDKDFKRAVSTSTQLQGGEDVCEDSSMVTGCELEEHIMTK